MKNGMILKLRDHRELAEAAAVWFHQKWGIPEAAYAQSIAACMERTAPVPQWYAVAVQERIIAGAGVIENDFHDRKDLTPNLCALYVEEDCRRQGLAGRLLRFISADLAAQGIGTLYLVTDHTAFYERYGWEFQCMVREDGGGVARLYRHQTGQGGGGP